MYLLNTHVMSELAKAGSNRRLIWSNYIRFGKSSGGVTKAEQRQLLRVRLKWLYYIFNTEMYDFTVHK